MSQDIIVICVIALIIVIGSCIALARAGRRAANNE